MRETWRRRRCPSAVPRRVLAVLALAACGRASPATEPIGNTAAPLIARPAASPPPPADAAPIAPRRPRAAPPDLAIDLTAVDAQIAMLRELVAASTGADAAEAQARLFHALADHPDLSRRDEALAIAAALVAGRDFAALPSADQVLHWYGVKLTAADRPAEARAMWLRLVKDYPQSTLVPDVYLGFGDQAFDAADLAGAEQFYRQVIQLPGAKRASYARYKLAWVHFNLARFDQALDGFVEVARSAPEPLRRHAASDAVRAYAEIGKPDQALAFFQRLDRARAGELVLRLGELLLEQGKSADAAVVLRDAIPAVDAASACRARLGLATAAQLIGNRAALLAAFAELAAQPRPAPCSERAAELVTAVAYAWNVEHLTLKSGPTDAIAAWGFAEALATTPAQRREAAHAQAELLWQRAAFASDALAWIAAGDAFHHAAAVGDPGADGIAIDAWTNAVRLSAAVGAQLRAGVAAIAARPGPAQARARALLAGL